MSFDADSVSSHGPTKAEYSAAAKLFDRQLVHVIEKFRRTLHNHCDVLQRKVERCESKMLRYTRGVRDQTDNELAIAENLVNKELRSKVIMSEWTGTFLTASKDETLDPVTFAFARFALNICLCYNDVPASYFVSSKVHVLLISLLQFESELVIGPSIIGLVHLSLHEEMKHEIVGGGVLPVLLKLMVYCKSTPILIQCCKLIASLSLHFPNKPQMANSGCFHAVIDLVSAVSTGATSAVRGVACAAVANIVNGSDANRVLSVELDAIRPLLGIIQHLDYDVALLNALKALCNIAYLNSYASGKILSFGGDVIIVDMLSSGDILRKPLINQVALMALSNMCNSESNQSHIGSSKGAIDICVRICEHAR